MIFLTALLAFYVTWALGANDVANSMGTSVGSKAVTLRQALIIAGVLEFTGAVLFGHQVSATIATDIVEPDLFAAQPQTLLMGMISTLIACGIWLQIATSLGLPVASSHAVVGALAGFGWVAIGSRAVAWSSIGIISLSWVLTPVLSGGIAILFYSAISRWILSSSNSIQQLYEWIPWLSTGLISVFSFIVLPSLFSGDRLSTIPIPNQTLFLGIGAIAAVSLTLINWRYLNQTLQSSQVSSLTAPSSSPHASSPTEALLARFQLLSACFVAFAHGSNDVGNGIAPLAAIVHISRTGMVPPDDLAIPLWILILGGIGIVSGLAILGKKVITTIGEGIIPLKPSGGFCAELATASTVLLASRLGLPVSTSHALVGAVVGVGLVQSFRTQFKQPMIQLQTVQQIALAWVATIPLAAGLSALVFSLLQRLF